MALLFSLTASTIVFEVALTRLFSAQFYYNFVYFVLSVGLLGISLGAASASDRISGGRWRALFLEPRLAAWAFAISAPLVMALLVYTPAVTSLAVGLATIVIPFAFSGAAVSGLFAARPAASSRLYLVDLAGAALGAAASPFLVGAAGLLGSALAVGFLCAVTARLASAGGAAKESKMEQRLGVRRLAAGALLVVAVGLVVAVIPSLKVLELRAPLRGDKPLADVLRQKTVKVQGQSSRWDGFARTDVVATAGTPSQTVFLDGGAASLVYRWQGPDDEALIRKDIMYFPFELAPPGKVAVIGAGAGREVQVSLLAGSPSVTAIELNRGSVELVRQLGDYAGRIYDRPEVETVIGDARGYLERTGERYDTIFLSLVMTDTAGRFGASMIENYALTVEAYHTYMGRLAPGGRLVVQVHSGDELTKALLTIIRAAGSRGLAVAGAVDRIVAVGPDPGKDHGTVHHPVLIFRPSVAFSERESTTVVDKAKSGGLKVYYAPHTVDNALRDLRSGQLTPAGLARATTADVVPATDARPFFYKLNRGVPRYLVMVLIAGLAATLWALFGLGNQSEATRDGSGSWSGSGSEKALAGLYVAGLGVGFMVAEVVLIQRLTGFLGHPVLAASVVLGALLAGAGAGSYAAGTLWREQARLRYAPLACMAALVLLGFVVGPLGHFGAGWAAAARVGVSAVVSALTGLFLGVPFPASIGHFGSSHPEDVPRLWAVNGAASVLGSAAAMVLAVAGGFDLALAGGVAAYGLAAACGLAATKSQTESSSRVRVHHLSGGDSHARTAK